jgi:hypothetical protein
MAVMPLGHFLPGKIPSKDRLHGIGLAGLGCFIIGGPKEVFQPLHDGDKKSKNFKVLELQNVKLAVGFGRQSKTKSNRRKRDTTAPSTLMLEL